MIALIRKDISLNLRTLVQSAAAGAIIILAFSRMESGIMFIAVWSMMIPYLYALMSCYTEELNKGLAFSRSLPIAPSIIVWSKLFSFLAVIFASSLYVLLLGLFVSYMGWLRSVQGFTLLTAVVGPWMFLFVFHGVFLFLFFTYGYKRAQTVVSMMSLVFLLPLVLPDSVRSRTTLFLSRIFGGPHSTTLGIFLLLVVAFFVDVLLTWRAARAFERKDLT